MHDLFITSKQLRGINHVNNTIEINGDYSLYISELV